MNGQKNFCYGKAQILKYKIVYCEMPSALIHTVFGSLESISGGITGKPQTAPLSSLRYLRMVFTARLARAASRAGARLIAAASHAVLQKPKTGMR